MHGGYAVQIGLDRPGAASVDRNGVHAARIEVTELTLVGIRRRGRIFGGGFKNRAEALAVRFRQDVEGSPLGEARRYGILIEPAAVGVPPEIRAGLASGIEVGAIDTAAGANLPGERQSSKQKDGRVF